MGRCETARKSQTDFHRACPRHRFGQGVQVLPAHKLRNDDRVIVDFTHAINRNDVGMLKSRSRSRLVHKLFAQRWAVDRRRNELHRHRTIEQCIVPKIHFAHAATTERPEQTEFLK